VHPDIAANIANMPTAAQHFSRLFLREQLAGGFNSTYLKADVSLSQPTETVPIRQQQTHRLD
jgi:hypothetical protein